MDKEALINTIIATADNYFKFVASIIEDTTYQSIILFEEEKIVCSPNNNYNNWGKDFYKLQKYNKCSLFEICQLKTKTKGGAIMWENVIHTEESLIIQEKRKKRNIHNGISLLLKPNKIFTFILTFCSSKDIESKEFYSSVIAKQDALLKKYKELINYSHLF